MKKTLALAALAAAFATASAQAADLGGNCCADLEERIAELEATTARKGNRKVSLQVYGQVNASLTQIDAGDYYDDIRVTQGAGDLNSSFVGFSGKAAITNDVAAGFVLEIDSQSYGLLPGAVPLGETNEIGTRQSYLYLKSATLGGISLGKTSNATNNFDTITTANTSIVAQPLSLQPVSNSQLGGIDLPFDGGYRNVVRYDTPVWAGFMASASWGASGLEEAGGDTGNMWDVALRYAGEEGGFRIAGGLGYRVDEGQEITIKAAGLDLTVPLGAETETFLAAGSVMHIASGLFLTANYVDQDWSENGGTGSFSLSMWQVQGGIETKLFAVGKSTFYAEYGELDVDLVDEQPELWGLGFVQAIEPAAMDLYVGYRSYSIADEDVDVIQGGARIKF